MAFIFSTSHLPETRVRRPDHLEDDEEEDQDSQPMPRAGGVRAFSHLPQPADDRADFEGPLSTRPATPVGRPRPHVGPEAAVENDDDQDTGHAPAPDSDHDDAPRAHEYEDDTPWHQPRITARALPPQTQDEDDDEGAPAFWHAPARFQQGSHSASHPAVPRTDTSGWQTAAQERDHPLHPNPDAQAAFPGRADFSMHDESTHGAPFGRSAGTGPARQLLASTGTGAPPAPAQPMITPGKVPSPFDPAGEPKPKPAPAPEPDPGRDTPPGKEPNKPATPPPAAPPAAPPPLKVHEADDTEEDAQGRTFGDTVRSIMRAEIAASPTAAALLQRASALSKKQVIIKKTTRGEAYTEIAPDGSITLYINPAELRPGTLSHEISHAIQGWHLEEAKKKKKAETGSDALTPAEMKAAKMAGRKELHSVVKVATPADGMEDSTEYRENEGVRSANVVTAEITAAETRAEIEALKKTNPAEYRRLTNDPMAVVEKFWRKQMEKEGVGHENNQRPIPKGTRYGLYDFAPVLRSLGYGVTQEHLKQWRQKNVGGH